MPSQTWVARFVVDQGRVTEEGGLLRTFHRRRLDETDVDLHILAEPSGEKGPELGAQAIENIGKLFMEDRLSLTGGVQRALRTTHQTLQEWNRRSIPREQVTTGVIAALVRGTLVYLWQGGPGLCFRGRDDRLQQLTIEPESLQPLGSDEFQPALRAIEMSPGDLIIAASESLFDVIDFPTLEALLARGTEDALPELYQLTKDLPSFALMAITCLETAEEPEEPPLSEEPVVTATPTADAGPRTAPDFFAEAEEDEEAEPEEPRLVGKPAVDISKTVVRLRSDQSIGRSDYARTTGPPQRFRLDISQSRILAIAGAVAIVLFIGAFTVPDLIRENRGERVASLLQSAQLQFNSSLNETDLEHKRTLLDNTSSLTSEILRLDEGHTEAATLRQQAQAAITELNASFDLGPMTTVITMSQQVTGAVSLDSMVVAAGAAYILDGRGGRILSVPLNNPAGLEVIYTDGESYRGTPARQPEFITWEGTDAEGRLLVLDGERKLFAIRPGSIPEPLPLRRTNTWASVAGIASYDGNFYILDATGNKVHRYRPAAAGYDSEPESILSGQVDFKDAIGLAIDGDIYVLKRTGQVLRFREGTAADFRLGGIDRGLTAPNALRVVSSASEIYISDAGNRRIVIASKEGEFRRQFNSSAFTDIRAIGIDSVGGQLYVVVGDQILTAPIVR